AASDFMEKCRKKASSQLADDDKMQVVLARCFAALKSLDCRKVELEAINATASTEESIETTQAVLACRIC
ncbi:hypothetical protein PENTCL1PPCAC_4744, partial [Pristionchus entomophagus]